MTHAANTPVLVGFGQVTLRDPEFQPDISPAFVMAEASKKALADTGVSIDLITSDLDDLVVVDTMRQSMDNLPAAVASLLNLDHCRQRLAPVSGHVPQVVINRVCAEVVDGETRSALIVGGEALASARKLIRRGEKPFWTGPEGGPELMFDRKPFATEHERAHGIWLAKDVYPLYETGLRAFYDHSVEEHSKQLGVMWASFSHVAAQNEYAWFRDKKSDAEIISPANGNRMISYPYTKTMNAMNQVDQGAAVLITSAKEAENMGIDPSRWVYLHGAAEADEHGFISQRLDYHSSPAIAAMGEAAFSEAETDIDEIDYIDLYSCFPCAVEIARDALGISKEDPRSLTVTGGLSFHGGPGGSYVLSALATMAGKLRENKNSKGLISANGGLLSEHAIGIYSAAAPSNVQSYDEAVLKSCQSYVDALAAPPLEENPHGEGTVEAYTVVHGKDGKPERGIVIGRLVGPEGQAGPRFLANTPVDSFLFEEMERTEFVGRRGKVAKVGGINLFQPLTA